LFLILTFPVVFLSQNNGNYSRQGCFETYKLAI
jgi:hypothetical protein